MLQCKPTLVFAHYFGGSRRAWSPLLAALDDSLPKIAGNLPGFGGASPFADGPSLDAHADHFAALAGEEPWIAVGHSMGGKIALAAATQRPDRLRAMILIAASPPTPEPMDEAARNANIAAFGDRDAAEAQLHALTCKTAPEARLSKAIIAVCVEDQLRVDYASWRWWLERGSRADISDKTKAIALPTLVISGDRDTVMETSVAIGIANNLPNARRVVVPGAGHLLPIEMPIFTAALIEQFISGLDLQT